MSFENTFSQFDTFRVELPIFFNMCENIEEIKFFYTDILGIKENAYQQNNFVDYNSKGLTMMFFQADSITNKIAGSKKRYSQGHFEPLSWTIKIEQDDFLKALDKISTYEKKNNCGLSSIQWNHEGFWSFSVNDPMGNKVIVYMEQKNIHVPKSEFTELEN